MGQSLSAPVTNQHVMRVNTDFYRAASVHLQGWRNNQEDACNIVTINPEKNIILFSVYDGHGGPLASSYLENAAPQVFAEIDSIDEDSHEFITKLILGLDHTFLTTTPHDDGSTACFVFAQPWDIINDKPWGEPLDQLNYQNREKFVIKILAANVGDSRALIIHPHKAKEGNDWFIQCTEDHKPQDPVERSRIVRAGGSVSANRVDGNLALSRAIGDRSYKDLSLDEYERKVIAVPDFTNFTINYGDILFVACDGIFEADPMTHRVVSDLIWTKTNQLRDELIADIIKTVGQTVYDENKAVVDQYIDVCYDQALVSRYLIERSLCSGSHDNHTAITITFAAIPNDFEHQDDPIKKWFDARFKALLDLPVTAVIPGPLSDSREPFNSSNSTDLGEITEEIEGYINEITHQIEVFTQSGDELEPEQPGDTLIPYPIDWSKTTLPFPPIAVTSNEGPDNQMAGQEQMMLPPQLLKLLFQMQPDAGQ